MLIVPHLFVHEVPLSPEGSIVDNKLPNIQQTFHPRMRMVLTYLDFEDCTSHARSREDPFSPIFNRRLPKIGPRVL
jgi:hypothetical protein